MNFRNLAPDTSLRPALQTTLRVIRATKAFDASAWCHLKAARLNDYFRANGLRGAVIAVSGGLDSAVGAALLVFASQQPDSPLKRIVPLLMPVHSPGAATGQDLATTRATAVCTHLGLAASRMDLTQLHGLAKFGLDLGLGIPGQESATERLAADLRTPMLYYCTSLLAQAGLPAVVIGTVSRDKGSYLGYYGKAGAGMCDLQIVSDAHRSELRAAAHVLGLPADVSESTSNADFADGRPDEALFGTSFDFVELFLALRAASPDTRKEWCDGWSVFDRKQYAALSMRLEKLHRYNAHKLLAGSPAIHLDVLDAHVPDGWHYAIVGPAEAC
jgi:NAD+ synthase (glutamine-hydrolysing)